MILKGKAIDTALALPAPGWRAVLLYGPDQGLVREYATRLARAIAADPDDPFRAVQISAAELKDDPARLRDEAAAISMTGGRRVIRLHGVTDSLAPLFADFLVEAKGDGLVVAEAGELTRASKLRKSFESADNAAIIACYGDTGVALEALIDRTLRQADLVLSQDAKQYLVQNLGEDRLITRSELEKLILYMGPVESGQRRRIEIDDVQACTGDQTAQGMDEICDAMGLGDGVRLDRLLSRARESDMAPVAILRMAASHMLRLQMLAGLVLGGRKPEAAISALRPPVHFSRVDAMRAQAGLWPLPRIARALEMLLEAEILCKTTGMPDTPICGRALLRVAGMAGGGLRQ